MEKAFLILIIFPSIVFSSLSSLSNTTSWIPELLVNPGIVNQLSCAGSCGLKVKNICYCDSQCEQFGDCCFDYWKQCTDSIYRNEDLMTAANALFDLNKVTELQYKSQVMIIDRSNTKMDEETGLSFHYAFNINVKTSCSQKATDLNSNACLNENITSLEGTTEVEKLLVSYYDKTDGVIYKNYYCGKCNSVSDENLIKMDYIKYCTSDVEDKIEKPNDVTFEFVMRSDTPCEILYNSPDTSNILRLIDGNKENWIGTDLAETSFFTGLNPNGNYALSILSDEKLCYLYLSPIKVVKIEAYGPFFFQNILTFKNIHCLKYFLSTINFGFSDFRVDNSTSKSLFVIGSSDAIEIKIGLLDTEEYSPKGYRYFKNAVQNDIVVLLNNFMTETNRLGISDIPLFSSSVQDKVFIEIENVTENDDPLGLYFNNQIYESIGDSYASDFYDFTLYFEVNLNTGLLFDVFSFEEWLLLAPTFSPLYTKLVESHLALQVMKRFNLNRFIIDNYTISINQTSIGEAIGKLYIPLTFNVANIETLNRITATLMKIVYESSSLQYYKIFEGIVPLVFNKIELLNGYFIEENTETYCSSENNTEIDIMELIGSYDLNKPISLYFDINSKYIHRLNSVNKFNNYNLNDGLYTEMYHYIVKKTLDDMTIKICYNYNIFNSTFVSYEKQDRCNIDKKLFYYEDDSRLSKVIEEKWTIEYEHNKTSHKIQINEVNVVARYDNMLYFICLEQNNPLINTLESVNELLRTRDDFNIIQVTAKSSILRSGSKITLVWLLINIFYF